MTSAVADASRQDVQQVLSYLECNSHAMTSAGAINLSYTIRLLQAFPPPPPYYKDFAPHEDSGDERMLPAPPPPVQGEYQLFGELHTVSCSPASCI